MQFHKRAYKPMDYKSLSNLGTDLTTFQANQLSGLNQQISVGAGSPEVIALGRDVWQTIPKPHFKEMKRLSKITGVEPSVHAPMIDTVGISQYGVFSEEVRSSEEKLIEDVIEKAHMMAPERNIIVNIHSEATGKAPTFWRKNLAKDLSQENRDRLAKDLFFGKIESQLSQTEKRDFEKELQKEISFGVDKESGQLVPLKFEVKYYPPSAEDIKKGREHKEEIWTPEKTRRNINETQWMGEVEGLHQHEFRLREVKDRISNGDHTMGLEGYQETLITHANSEILALFNKLKKHSKFEKQNWEKLRPDQQKLLRKEKEKYDEIKAKQLKQTEELDKRQRELLTRAGKSASDATRALAMQAINENMREKVNTWANFFATTVATPGLTPHRIVPLEQFSIDKASKTFAEAAEHSLFDVAKGKIKHAPIISIENPPAMQFGLSRAEEMKDLVKQSREKAVSLFKKKHRMSEAEARKAAEKLIGVTWDTGHINLLKQGGYTDKDILKETKTIAPYVKHFHIVDNFGLHETHLPPGMGNVPIDKMQEEIVKAGFKGKSVIEAGNFISSFKTSPWPYVLKNMDSPIYEFDAAPTWGPNVYQYEAVGSAEYVSGYGNMLPAQHYSMYGAGFLLPPSLGAAMPGESKKSEFSGTPTS